MGSNLPIINPRLFGVIQKKYPTLNYDEIVVIIHTLEDRLATHLEAGDLMSFVTRYRDGTWDLTVYGEQIIDDTIRRRGR